MMHTLRLCLVHKERAGAVNHFTAALQLRPCNTECCLQTKHLTEISPLTIPFSINEKKIGYSNEE